MSTEPKYRLYAATIGLVIEGEGSVYDTWDDAAKQAVALGWARWENVHVLILNDGVRIKAVRE